MTSAAHSGRGDISRSLDLMWRGREPSSRGPKPGLTLERIVEAAVELADRDGIAALSMRNVATALGVGTMSLYRYVPGKSELLDLMLDHVEAPGPGPAETTGKDWRTALQTVGEGSYRLFLRHPWLLQVNQARPLLGPNALLNFEFTLAALDGLGLTSREKIGLITTLDAYVSGLARQHVLAAQANEEAELSQEQFWATQGPVMTLAYESGAYPHVFALDPETFSVESPEYTVRFGLARLLDGFEAFIATRNGDAG
ncbi:TetR/AcrR family transcriptional regulator [Streptomyces hainanensis]|uniref:TetR/AcrR family transcriptional regulator n=1 Tax=Streptomyces hainanensis TaxID=402648 RepID=A0A4V2Y357_9ACTN|nr:TetR/AcrR family transcriptional regulator [Streptomyces hainanensis]TDC75195.1 TetR/AcrR family transcriptional regulator [Streptomyces hainanensis]